MNKKPLIGITTYHITSKWCDTNRVVGVKGQTMVASSLDYSGFIRSGGGIPILLPTLNDPEYIKEITDRCDGILFAGGEDLDPKYLAEPPSSYVGTTDLERDQFELDLFAQFIKTDKPILGICRGCQVINVALGGTLYQDYREISKNLSYHCEQPYQSLIHAVHLTETLQKCYQTDQISVNSHHHQFLKDVPEILEISGVAPDGIIEAISHKTHRFLHAVQWHPEMIYRPSIIEQKLSKWFVDHC